MTALTIVTGLALAVGPAAGLRAGDGPTGSLRAGDGPAAAARWTEPAPGVARLDIVSGLTGLDYVALVRSPEGPAPAGGWPTLWMMDGFATFPLVGGAEEAGAPEGFVVAVGFPSGEDFDNARRSQAYTPAPDADPGAPRSGPVLGGAEEFRRFLLEELRPELLRRFPSATGDSTLFGFSYGGLFTLDTLLREPGAFDRYWAASPSVWFSEAQVLRRLRSGGEPLQRAGGPRPPVTITAGVEEQFPSADPGAERLAHLKRRAMIDNTAEAARLLREAGLPVTLIHAPGKGHMDMLHEGAAGIRDFAFAPAAPG